MRIRARVHERRRPLKRFVAHPLRAARFHLKQFRGATLLAVALTGLLIMAFSPSEGGVSPATNESTVVEQRGGEKSVQDNTEESVRTLYSLVYSFYGALPKILIAIAVLFMAWLLNKLFRVYLRRIISRWESLKAFTVIVGLAVWFLAVGIAVSVLAGDIRGLVGSLGLLGLALSWALQAPIESFTGWLLNSFKGYYRVGDRIAVADVFGDVYRIDLLTTTLWEIGGPFREGFVRAEQPTGRLVTFPNNAILTSTVVNLTRDFPYVWDELTVQVSNESDLPYTMRLLQDCARTIFTSSMAEAANRYAEMLDQEGLEASISEEPRVFVSFSESWTEVTIRYLVGVRERRKWKSDLAVLIMEKLNNEDHGGRILPVYPRRQVQFIDSAGVPKDISEASKEAKRT